MRQKIQIFLGKMISFYSQFTDRVLNNVTEPPVDVADAKNISDARISTPNITNNIMPESKNAPITQNI